MSTPTPREIERQKVREEYDYYVAACPEAPDPKDATIATLTEQRDQLKAEVERLHRYMAESSTSKSAADARRRYVAQQSVDLLRRMGLA